MKAFQPDTTWLYAVAFLATFSLAGLETAFPFLAFDRLGATTRSVGYIFAVMGISGSIVQGGLIGPIRNWIGEERMIPVGLLISAAALLLIAWSKTAVAASAALALFAAGHGLIRPANASLDHPAHPRWAKAWPSASTTRWTPWAASWGPSPAARCTWRADRSPSSARRPSPPWRASFSWPSPCPA